MSPIPSFDVYNLKTDREYLFRVTPRNKYGWGEAAMTPQPIRVGRRVEPPSLPHALPHHVRAMPGSCICIDAQVRRMTTGLYIFGAKKYTLHLHHMSY